MVVGCRDGWFGIDWNCSLGHGRRINAAFRLAQAGIRSGVIIGPACGNARRRDRIGDLLQRGIVRPSWNIVVNGVVQSRRDI